MPIDPSDADLNNLKQWADDLVCPVCYADLSFEEATVLCTGCARVYPLVDGIPVLIPQRTMKAATNSN